MQGNYQMHNNENMILNNQNHNIQNNDLLIGFNPTIDNNQSTQELPNLLEQEYNPNSYNYSKYTITPKITNEKKDNNNINKQDHNEDYDNDDEIILNENLLGLEIEDNKTINKIIEELTVGHAETKDCSNFNVFDFSKMSEEEFKPLQRKRTRKKKIKFL